MQTFIFSHFQNFFSTELYISVKVWNYIFKSNTAKVNRHNKCSQKKSGHYWGQYIQALNVDFETFWV